jgi:integrase
MRKKIDFKAVQSTSGIREVNENLTLAELANAWLAVGDNERDETRLRKWIDGYGARIAWSLTTDELIDAMHHMINSGYKPSSVNRDIGCLGSMYKWIIRERRAPAEFVSPTINIKRFQEPVRVVDIPTKDLRRLKDLALVRKDRRFGLFVHLLCDTGCRKSEVLERTWDDLDLKERTIKLATSKNGKPRFLHFTEATANLIARVCPVRPGGSLIFAGRDGSSPNSFRTAWALLRKQAEAL